MGGNVRRRLLAAVCCCTALSGCGSQSSDRPLGRTPIPAPRVELSAGDREMWAPGPPERSAIPVLLYDDVAPDVFARQMTLLDYAGYDTVTLADLVRFIHREKVSLPAHPLVLTFDDGRLDSWTGRDGILRKLGFNAVVFVDVGRVESRDPQYLTWAELGALQRSGRWEVQLQSGTGNQQIRYGPRSGEVGPFYAYRGADEVLGGWRERVFSDISYGEQQLAFHVPGYRPVAFAPPDGNYGQAGTNDPRIPRLLLARLELSFKLVFTQDRSGFAAPGDANPIGRAEVGREMSDAELHALLSPP
jgi:Polysaccharide deacetylase